ncbi:MAG: PVC-type heme-binding CxxCH protein, partial [Isosphaeraceae bacterium]
MYFRLTAIIPLAAALAVSLGADPPNKETRPPELVASTEPGTPEDERKGFHLPPGFEAQLVACEPDIHKPMNLAFDDLGRLWVTSSLEYPFPAKDGTTPRDRVIILDQFGPDGRAGKITTFADGLNIPIGVFPLTPTEALVHSIPKVWRLTDTDGDGKADQRTPAYQTYGSQDTHGMTSAFTQGFDGWIYACHGFSNTSTVQGADGQPITMQSGNTYRMRPDGSHLERFTHGQVNPFGIAIDPLGNLFTCDCHSRPIYQLLRGAYYPSFGKADDGLGFGPAMMSHDHGSTGIGGITYYSADHFPKPWRDTIFIGNVVTSRINHDRLERRGSTLQAIIQPDFLV